MRKNAEIIRWSRRSLVLVLVGLLFILTGIGWFTLGYPVLLAEAYPPLAAHMAIMGLYKWAAVFIGSGAIAVWCGAARKWTLGYVVLMAVSSWWSLLYFVSFAMNGEWRAVTQGSIAWLLVTGFLATISGWPDHLKSKKILDEDDLAFIEEESK